jgi:predicted transcriptional regulator
MRTTIELRDDQRARLLEIAARRGEKGFSRLVQEAVDRFLEAEALRDRATEDAVRAMGSLPTGSAGRMHEAVRHLRDRWR